MNALSRREFLKLSALQLSAVLLPRDRRFSLPSKIEWPSIFPVQLPKELQLILQRIPNAGFDENGYLYIGEKQAAVIATDWSKDHSLPDDLLYENYDWGIVLHWFGDREDHQLNLAGYLQGFNGERVVDGKTLRTSAHFLVIDNSLVGSSLDQQNLPGIIQTQLPGPYGRPYVSSHLLPAPFEELEDPRQYFIRAFDESLYGDPNADSILQFMSLHPRLDPNMVTFSIEIAGHDFDRQESYPSREKIANVVSIIWALMKRYRIPALNILGHLEINLDKPDPGKKFLSLIRLLVGVKALLSTETAMKDLTFSSFYSEDVTPSIAVWRYFRFVREYLLLISDPQTVYEWESESKYWFIQDLVLGTPQSRGSLLASALIPLGRTLKEAPESLIYPQISGIQLLANESTGTNPVRLMGNGECVFAGSAGSYSQGDTAIFRHRERDGSEVLSIYSALDRIADLTPGRFYSKGFIIGEIDTSTNHFQKSLQFSIAYAGTWEKDKQYAFSLPGNVGSSWISKRFIDPQAYIHERIYVPRLDKQRLALKLLDT